MAGDWKGLGLVALLAAAMAGPAAAQPAPGPPISILPAIPSGSRPPESASLADPGADPGTASEENGSPQAAGSAGSEPGSRPLGLGLIDGSTGGFDPGLWVGSDTAEVARLVEQLPASAPSPAMRGIIARLLFTRPVAGNDPEVDNVLAAARVEKAAEMAFLAELSDLVTQAPSMPALPGTQRILAEMRLIAGDLDRACVDRPMVPVDGEGGFWQQLEIICLIEQGEAAEALEALDRMEERGTADDLFQALATAWASRGQPEMPDGAWRSLAEPSPTIIALQRPLARGFVTAALRVDDPARLLAIATDEQTSSNVRLDAAERAAAAGVMTPGDLARLYSAVPVGSDDLTGIIDRAARSIGPYERALLTQLADGEADAAREAAIRIYALELSRVRGVPLAVVLALLDPLRPSAVTERVAPAAAGAYFAAGRFVQAQSWLDLAAELVDTPEEQAAIARIWPLRLLADDAGLGPEDQRRWFESQLRGQVPAGRHSVAVGLTALQALGYSIEPAAPHWLPADDERETATLPNAVVWWRLSDAAAAGRQGETVLLAMHALGPEGPAGAHPAVLGSVLWSLRNVGLGGEARRLGREAIWAAIQ